jgi:hypothetical protein
VRQWAYVASERRIARVVAHGHTMRVMAMEVRNQSSRGIGRGNTFYVVGTGILALVGLAVVMPPRNANLGEVAPPAIVSGTPLPALLNSPDTHCEGRRCSDGEFNGLMSDLERQWAITPQWIRSQCISNGTFPAMEHCILQETRSWLGRNPNRQAPWLNPANVGDVVKESE